MYKGSVDLGRINNGMRLKFNLILNSDTDGPQNKLLRKFQFNGNEFLRLNPHPYLSIDISGPLDKGEEWSSARIVNLNKRGIFNLSLGLEEMVQRIKTKNLYYKEEDKLTVNQDIAKKYVKTIMCAVGKYVRLQFCVVPDEQNPEIEYEGIVFMINNPENFCYLTYDEMRFLLNELQHIDLIQLSLLLVNSALFVNNRRAERQPRRVESEVIEQSISAGNHYASIKEPNVLPKL